MFFLWREWGLSRFVFLHVDIQLLQIICWKDHLSSIVLALLFCQWSVDYYKCRFFSVLCSISLIYLSIFFFANTILSWLLQYYCKSVVSVFQLCSFPPILCWLFWVLSILTYTLESVCKYSQNNMLGFCLG